MLFFTGLMCIVGCSSDKPAAPPDVVEPPDPVPDPQEIDCSGFHLTVYLWKDLMPGPGPEATGLIASICVTTVDSSAIPADIDAALVRVVRGNETWGARLSEERRPPSQLYKLCKIARWGPLWRTGQLVDVFVKMVNDDGDSCWLVAYDQTIHEVW